MPIFDAGSPAFQTVALGTTGAQVVWSGTNSVLTGTTWSSTNLGPTLRDITIMNIGTATAYLGSRTMTAAGTVSLLPVPSGAQLTIQGWTANAGTTTSDIYAYCGATFANPTTLVAGLASLASVV